MTAGMTLQARRKLTAPQTRVLVRTFADWPQYLGPGYTEIDLVVHSGPTVAGSVVSALTLTDIASGWTECVALLVREASLVTEAIDAIRCRVSFALNGVDSDNGSEFLNDTLLSYCALHHIEFTRSRPPHKNDQAWVGQKNGSVVRRLVGYSRFEGVAATGALLRLAVQRLISSPVFVLMVISSIITCAGFYWVITGDTSTTTITTASGQN